MKKLLVVIISLTLSFCDAVLADAVVVKEYYTHAQLLKLQAEFKLPEPLGLPRTKIAPVLFDECKKKLGEYEPSIVFNNHADYYMVKRWHREHVAIVVCARKDQQFMVTTMTYHP